MIKLLLIFLLVVPLSNLLAQDLSDEKAISLIKEAIKKEPNKIYSVSLTDSLKKFTIEDINIIKRGKFMKENEYWPVRVRVKGKAFLVLWGNSNPLWAKKHINSFDKILEARLKTNDFDEWEVDIVRIKETSKEIIKEEKKQELKEKQKFDPLYKYCQHKAGWYKYKAISNLSIRNRPSIKGKKVGKLKKGEIINGICYEYEILKNDVSGFWVSINESGGNEQFVFGHYLIPVDTKHTPIPVKFLGEWDVKSETMINSDHHCAQDNSDSKVTIKPYAIAYWESGGSVKDLEVIDSNSVKFSLLMGGEGESWTSKFKLNLEKNSLIIKRDDSTNTYVRCK